MQKGEIFTFYMEINLYSLNVFIRKTKMKIYECFVFDPITLRQMELISIELQ